MLATEALSRWGLDLPLSPAPDAGLINRTWLVGEPPQAVLQWVNPIFKPSVHLDIEAITARLAERGLPTPRLLRDAAGALWIEDESACWRLMTFIPGRTLHRLDGPERAAAAGRLVGRFHAATAGWDYAFQHRRPGAHDTLAHMATLRAALDEADGHPLAGPARELGAGILLDWDRWEGDLDQPARVCHGDLKVSNLRFDPSGRDAVCLLDLDTMAALPLSVEMGDAWRSWCNPAGEEDPEASRFDLSLFQASAQAWLSEVGPLSDQERASLVPGVERICLELAARFCADAIRNSYFREDRERHPQRGAHNLLRARSQHQLARSAKAQRAAASEIVASASPRRPGSSVRSPSR